jgi:hypothetical protein
MRRRGGMRGGEVYRRGGRLSLRSVKKIVRNVYQAGT